jgi:Skp family chaperone for outer membrane proteins
VRAAGLETASAGVHATAICQQLRQVLVLQTLNSEKQMLLAQLAEMQELLQKVARPLLPLCCCSDTASQERRIHQEELRAAVERERVAYEAQLEAEKARDEAVQRAAEALERLANMEQGCQMLYDDLENALKYTKTTTVQFDSCTHLHTLVRQRARL